MIERCSSPVMDFIRFLGSRRLACNLVVCLLVTYCYFYRFVIPKSDVILA
jgi:hypothetical protein